MAADGEGVGDHDANGPLTVSQPLYDPYFTANEKIIQDLLIDEKRYHSNPSYCIKQHIGVAKWMRRTLLNWLRDVCVHRQTDAGVLAQTAQLIDRFLHVVPTDRREYQLVGSTCFFIASKLKETVPVPLREMMQYTDFSVTQEDIVAKELTICLSLHWDLTCITPIDFIAPVVDFLEFVSSLKQIIRQAALNIFIKAFHVEELGMYLPSYMAAACILYALNLTVHPDLSDVALRSVTRIQQLLRLEARKIREVYQHLQSCFEPGTVQLSEAVIRADSNPPTTPPETSVPTQPSPQHSTGLLPNTAVLMPLATSTQLQPRRVNGSSTSTSLSSVGNSSGSFDRSSHPPSNSISTSSPASESDAIYLSEVENEQPHFARICASRRSAPYVTQSHHAQFLHSQQPHHPNGYAAGQTLAELTHAKNGWKSTVTTLMGPLPPTTELLQLKATVYPCDPRFLILAAAGLPQAIQRGWTPTDIREVQLE
ncbi:Cyclin domain protein [Paragonimus heterotremus]|uniref:Cyclin domain protein n=1 Tax=Paragonimus heterotremus TaxID=100268 RepID=A0A8J4SJE7_9TREM|nr:Cyclin domain protein [Paragonimus heterotremus]